MPSRKRGRLRAFTQRVIHQNEAWWRYRVSVVKAIYFRSITIQLNTQPVLWEMMARRIGPPDFDDE